MILNIFQIPPSLDEGEETSFVMVQKEDVELSGDRTEVYQKLEQDLINQIRVSGQQAWDIDRSGTSLSI